jgi:hypothetical protein
MGHAVPRQHPAVVLRSHFNLIRALLAVAMIAVVGLTVALVIVANDDDGVTGSATATPNASIEYGGFNPGTGRPNAAPLPQQEPTGTADGLRYDGGPEEGTSGAVPATPPPSGIRYDGGPEEGTSGIASAPAETPSGPGFNTD